MVAISASPSHRTATWSPGSTVAPTSGSDGAGGATVCRRRQENSAAIHPVSRRPPRMVSVVAIAISAPSVMPSHSRFIGMDTTTTAGISTAAHSRWAVVNRKPNWPKNSLIGASGTPGQCADPEDQRHRGAGEHHDGDGSAIRGGAM